MSSYSHPVYNRAGKATIIPPNHLEICLDDLNLINTPQVFDLLYHHISSDSIGAIQTVTLSFENMNRIQPGLLPGICSWSYWLWETGRKLKIIEPISNLEFFRQMRFLNAVQKPSETAIPPQHYHPRILPISTFSCADINASTAPPRQLVEFVKSAARIDYDTEQALLVVMSELIENAIKHSNSSKFGTYCAAYHPQTRKLTLTLSDPGIGIYSSFMSGYSEDAKCRIRMGESPTAIAVEPLQSSKYGRGHSGYGLFFTRELVRINNGTLNITSHDETLSYFQSEKQHRHSQVRGVTLVILLDLGNRLDAARAWSALPSSDSADFVAIPDRQPTYVDYSPPTHDGRIVSRTAAGQLRAEVSAIIDDRGGVNIDLSRLLVITPSAADELFGQLYHELGHDRFVRLVRVCNASDYQRHLIELIIGHRKTKPF